MVGVSSLTIREVMGWKKVERESRAWPSASNIGTWEKGLRRRAWRGWGTWSMESSVKPVGKEDGVP